mmetsp:Transcript_2840/g.11468  ORF Transcript_2840/g.11468 Transcript_2840/m.11468 type:complete len:390 (-) Transcript_2840:70-1239(-)
MWAPTRARRARPGSRLRLPRAGCGGPSSALGQLRQPVADRRGDGSTRPRSAPGALQPARRGRASGCRACLKRWRRAGPRHARSPRPAAWLRSQRPAANSCSAQTQAGPRCLARRRRAPPGCRRKGQPALLRPRPRGAAPPSTRPAPGPWRTAAPGPQRTAPHSWKPPGRQSALAPRATGAPQAIHRETRQRKPMRPPVLSRRRARAAPQPPARAPCARSSSLQARHMPCAGRRFQAGASRRAQRRPCRNGPCPKTRRGRPAANCRSSRPSRVRRAHARRLLQTRASPQYRLRSLACAARQGRCAPRQPARSLPLPLQRAPETQHGTRLRPSSRQGRCLRPRASRPRRQRRLAPMEPSQGSRPTPASQRERRPHRRRAPGAGCRRASSSR